jgi:hypothetical protein
MDLYWVAWHTCSTAFDLESWKNNHTACLMKKKTLTFGRVTHTSASYFSILIVGNTRSWLDGTK